MEFDNSYSYLRSKNIWYRITVDLPISERSASWIQNRKCLKETNKLNLTTHSCFVYKYGLTFYFPGIIWWLYNMMMWRRYTIYVDVKGSFSYKLKKFGRYNIIKRGRPWRLIHSGHRYNLITIPSRIITMAHFEWCWIVLTDPSIPNNLFRILLLPLRLLHHQHTWR